MSGADKPDEMAKTLDRLVRTIDAEAPDMIVFTGDVVTGRPAAKAWRAILDPVARRNIPFVVVLGNHDREQDLREEQIAQLVTAYPNSLNAAEDGRLSDIAVPIISGRLGAHGSSLVLHRFQRLLHYRGAEKYGWIRFEQIEHYRRTSREYTLANGGKPLPSYAFFHIPLPEYAEACTADPKAVRGIRREAECAPPINTGMFAAMKECGDIVATFVGHDHDNDYIIPHHGIALVYGRYSGDNTVYNHLRRGVRIIELTEGSATSRHGYARATERRSTMCVSTPDPRSCAKRKE